MLVESERRDAKLHSEDGIYNACPPQGLTDVCWKVLMLSVHDYADV